MGKVKTNKADFAKTQLLKYGWTEGKGLGKDENGITKMLKPIVKLDNAGLGYKTNEYDNLIQLINTKTPTEFKHTSQQIYTNSADQCKTFIDTYKNSQQTAYEKFQNTSILQNGNLIQNASAISNEEESTKIVDKYFPTIDEELFKKCDGRTGHPTARHGYMLGKLKRIALQDKLFLNAHVSGMSQSNTNQVAASTSHRKIRTMSDTEETVQENDSDLNMFESETEVSIANSKIIKKMDKKMNNLSQQLSTCNIKENDTELVCKLQENNKKSHKKRKKKKLRKNKKDLSLSRNSFKPKITDKSIEYSSNNSIDKYLKHYNMLNVMPNENEELFKLVQYKEQKKHKICNEEEQAKSQQQDCIITIDKTLWNQKLPISKFALMPSDMQNQQINPLSKQNIATLQHCNIGTMKPINFNEMMPLFEVLKSKSCVKKHNLLREINVLMENNIKIKKNKNKASSNKKNEYISLEKMTEITAKLNLRIKKRKNQRSRAKKKKQLLHKLKEKVFLHDVNALIKDLTSINIAENVNTKKLTQTHRTPV